MRQFIYTLLLFFIIGGPADARNLLKTDSRRHRSHFGIKFGLINGGTAYINGQSYSTKVALTGGVYFDIVVTPWLYSGISINLHDVQIDQFRQKMLEISYSIKPAHYSKMERSAFKPAFEVGFADLGQFGPEDYKFERTQYLTLKVGVEMVFFSEKNYAWTVDVVLWGSPHCFNSDLDITFGPLLIGRLGFMFL